MRIDAHQHFWSYSPEAYPWITDDLATLRRDFGPEDLAPHLAEHGFDGCVAVQARASVDETRELLDHAARHANVLGVVGWFDLTSREVERELDAFAGELLLVGVRHIVQDEPDDRFLARADFRAGVAALGRRGLVYDVLVFPRHLAVATEFVDALPDQPFVLDHLAKPPVARGELEPWATELRALARREHVTVKLSGLVTEADWSAWTPEQLAPYLDVALEAFGPRRVLFGSDWPVLPARRRLRARPRRGRRLGGASLLPRTRGPVRRQRAARVRSATMSRPYFLTGALGCIGAWVVHELVRRGDRPVVFDLGGDPRRLRDLLTEEEVAGVRFLQGDVTDADAVRSALEESGAQRVVHLAGLQVPFCRADPALGARVNVVGTLNVLQAAQDLGCERVVYASSAAVYGPEDRGPGGTPPDEDTPTHPTTHYGVYKCANEGNARVAHAEGGVSSIGLRPLTVYGVGRDQGMTSDPTRAMKAALVGRPFRIRFAGATDFLFAPDCAAAFLACADRAPDGAHVFNLHGESATVADFVDALAALLPETREWVTIDGPELPLPPELDGARIRTLLPDLPATPLAEGIRATLEHFRALRDAGRLRTGELSDG